MADMFWSVVQRVKTELQELVLNMERKQPLFSHLYFKCAKEKKIKTSNSLKLLLTVDQTWYCQPHRPDAFPLTKHWNTILSLLICITMEFFAAGKR